MRKHDEAKGKLYQEQEINFPFAPLIGLCLTAMGRMMAMREVNLPPTIVLSSELGEINVARQKPINK